MKLRDKIIVIMSFLIILTLGITLSFANRETKETVANKKEKYVTVVDDTGTWEILNYFTSNSTNVEIEDNLLRYYNNEDPLSANEIVLHFNTTMVESNVSSLPPASLAFYVNSTSLFFYDDSYENYVIDTANNQIIYKDDNNNQVGYIKVGADLPYCDFYGPDGYDLSSCSGNADYYWYFCPYGLIVVNGKEITNLASYSSDIQITFAMNSSFNKVQEYTELYDMFEVAGNPYDYQYLAVSVSDKVDNIDLSNIHTDEEIEYTSWQSQWGSQSGNYDYYVLYPLVGSINFSSNYQYKVSLELTEGDVLAYSSNGNIYYTGDASDFAALGVCDRNVSGESNASCYVVVGYNRPQQETSVNFLMHANVQTSKENKDLHFSWNHILSPGGPVVEPEYPSGTNVEIVQRNNNLTAGEGAVNKLLNGNEVAFSWLIESNAGSITDGFKAFNLWNNTNKGTTNYTVSINSNGEELDTTYDTSSNPHALSASDYNIVSFYPQDDMEYDYALSGNEYHLVQSNDYANYGHKDVYVSINNGNYELIGYYVRTNNGISYIANDNRTQSNNNVTEGNPVVLPSNVTKVRVTYTGARAAIYMGINVNTKVIGSDNVKSLLNSMGDSIVLKNAAGVLVAGETEITQKLGTYLTRLEITSHARTTSTVNERIENGLTDSISYEDVVYEELAYTDNKNEALNSLSEQKNGTVYELLPRGAELNSEVTVKTVGNKYSCNNTKSLEDNYNGSGRTLLTINIGTCSNANYYDTGSAIQSGFVINYDLKYTSLANQSNGTSLVKDMMYVGSAQLGNGYSSPSAAPANSISGNEARNLFTSLVTGNNNLLFTTNTATVQSISISVGTFSKEVKNVNGNSYGSTASVVESGRYSYKLQYSFTSELEQITNVVFMDKLESDHGTNGFFKGYLDSVDVSYLTNLGVDAKVYYATADLDISVFDVTKWTLNKPDDVTTIKAIAVACGSYVFKGNANASPMVYVNLVAPNSYAQNIKAYNKAKVVYKNIGDTNLKSLDSEMTTVVLNKASITVDGTSNYGKGSNTAPAVIDGDLSYEITVKNTDTVNGYDNVVVDIQIPSGLSATSPSATNNKVTYTVDHIDPGEEKKLTINLAFAEPATGGKVYKASYKLTSLNGHSYNGTEGYIYNTVNLPAIEAHKYAKTADVNNFSDIAGMLVKQNEEFTYRVSIVNTSNKVANNVTVVDTVPEGLDIVTSSLNGGVVNNRTITWVVNVPANSTTNIDYKVKVASNAVLGTTYRSSAHVSLENPFVSGNMLYDEDTNVIAVLYQIASNVKVTNKVTGALADANKEFEFVAEFNGTESNVGEYDVFDNQNNSLGTLVLNDQGKGSFTFRLKKDGSLTFKNLTGGINYTIKQSKYAGYTSHVNVNEFTNDNYVSTSGVTNTEGTASYTFTNAYSASGSITLNAKVTYDKSFDANTFKVAINNAEMNVGADGVMTPKRFDYSNQTGQVTYVIKQVDTGVSKVSYDSREFKAVVNIVDNKQGALTTTVKYYDNNNHEVNEVVFENKYLPNGLTISNINNSEYVDSNKQFDYEIVLTNGEGNYEVKDSNGNELNSIEFVNGTATYNISLLSNESILISDLPDGVNYTIKQRKVDYYTVTTSDESTDEDGMVIVSGVTVEGSKEIKFDNRYETRANFEPVIKVQLEGKEMEDKEFKFKLVDVSSGSTNGYTLEATNDVDGNVVFGAINYTKPGTYKYEIVQLDNGSNHIYFDFSKITLVLELTDNGDGTMNVVSQYEYGNDGESLVNKYSSEPIHKEEENKETNSNPKTSDRIKSIVLLAVIALLLFITERWIRRRRFEMGV